jgi:hypothetical protein
MYPRRMRSVKGTRRRFLEFPAARTAFARGRACAYAVAGVVAIALAVVAVAGCSRAPLGAAPVGAGADVDCRMVVRKPVSPRLVEVTPEGTVAAGPPCATATCIAGAHEAFAWRDAGSDVVHVTVGGKAQRSLDVPLRPASPLHATHTVLGVVLGRGVAVIDRGDKTVEIIGADGRDVTAPLPDLGARIMGRARAFDDGVFLLPTAFEDRGPAVDVVAMKTPRPAGAGRAISDEENKLIGWLVTGENAAFVGVDGVRRELGISIPTASELAKVGPWFVAVERRKRTLITFEHPPLEFDEHIELLGPFGNDGAVVGFDTRPPGSVVVVRDGKIESVATLPAPEHGAHVLRVLTAAHRAQLLVLQRVQDDGCNTRDRAFLVDASAQPPSITLLADDGDMRMQPTWTNDRFRFVEGEAELSSP